MITDLVTAYGMNLNLTVCFETSGPCEINIQVLKENKLTKPTCNWTRDFVKKGLWININISDCIVITITVKIETVFYQFFIFFKDFSLENWLDNKGYKINTVLPSYAVSELLHDLDIIQYMEESICDRKTVPFHPSKSGWNNGLYIFHEHHKMTKGSCLIKCSFIYGITWNFKLKKIYFFALTNLYDIFSCL